MTEPATGQQERVRPFRVLIVDDNQDAADSLSMLASMWGYDVRTAYNGERALEAARAFGPDCLLLDIGLPGINGYEVARAIREQPALRRAKLVAMSAYSSDEHRREAAEAGFDYCLVKPTHPETVEDLLTMMERALKMVERTESLAQKNVELAEQTREVLCEVKAELKEVKEEIREVKQEIKEVKQSAGGDRHPATP